VLGGNPFGIKPGGISLSRGWKLGKWFNGAEDIPVDTGGCGGRYELTFSFSIRSAKARAETSHGSKPKTTSISSITSATHSQFSSDQPSRSSCSNNHNNNRVPTLLLTKNPGLFQDPIKNFPGPFWSPRMFKYKEKQHLLTIFCSPLQKIQHEAKCGRQLSEFRWTYGLLYTCSDCRKMHDFQGYFSRTFQVLEFSRKKSRTLQYFPGGVRTLATLVLGGKGGFRGPYSPHWNNNAGVHYNKKRHSVPRLLMWPLTPLSRSAWRRQCNRTCVKAKCCVSVSLLMDRDAV